MPRYDNILETIGNTPLVKLQKLAPPGVNVYVKVESFNPMGSIKDRMARAIIEAAETSGDLKPGQTVIEATSGNTGISLAMVCAQKGYPLVVTMTESASIERRKILRFLGARVVLTPAAEKGTGMLNKAIELADKHGFYLCRQFENEANADAHSTTTAREILEDFADDNLHFFVSGFGTGGTLLGVARTLKADNPDIRIVAAEPDNSRVLGSGIAQPRAVDGTPTASHPNFRPHLMQGWSPDFISALTQNALDGGLVDEIIPVGGDDAMKLSKALARKEGIFAGTTSGATLSVALEIAGRSQPGTNIVCMLPDTGERYMSTPLFDGIGVDMSEDEMVLSNSTPTCRFEQSVTSVQKPPLVPAGKAGADLDVEAEQLTSELISNEPVVMFALQWCEFSWSVRKLFDRLGIAYQSVDLDSVEYQANDVGGRIRTVLNNRIGSPTIPQIFIGGRHMGGCIDVLDAMLDGSMQAQLKRAAVAFDESADIDPYELLPKWVHPRKSA